MRRRAVRALLAIAIGGLGGCGVTDTGNPPLQPGIDTAEISGMSLFGGTSVSVRGAAMAIDPPSGTLRITNLDDDGDPVDGAIAADGSFIIQLPAEAGDELRLQVLDGDLRSPPEDIDASAFARIERPLADCVMVSSDLDLGRNRGSLVEADLTIENHCAEEVRLGEPTARRAGVLAIEATLEGGMVLEPEAMTVLSVRATPTRSGAVEEVLFLPITTPAASRLPITLHMQP